MHRLNQLSRQRRSKGELIQLSSAHEKYGFRTRPNYIIHNHVLYHCFQGYNKPNAYIATQGMWKRSLYLLSNLYNVTKSTFCAMELNISSLEKPCLYWLVKSES